MPIPTPQATTPDDGLPLDDAAFEAAFQKAWAIYSEDMKLLMNYGDGRFQDTDEDDCLRTLMTVAIETYILATRPE